MAELRKESSHEMGLHEEQLKGRTLFDHRIETFDPYHGEVKVWQN